MVSTTAFLRLFGNKAILRSQKSNDFIAYIVYVLVHTFFPFFLSSLCPGEVV